MSIRRRGGDHDHKDSIYHERVMRGIPKLEKEVEREKRSCGVLLCIMCALIPPYVSIPVYIPPYFISIGCS